eukprot:GHVU01052464.1.p2 GENE.GHVU01052464.1~~GHVU01052464.1.p2  ORF type:complete len:133 (+),score=5.67 GHVU01052464.1:194-592(+)
MHAYMHIHTRIHTRIQTPMHTHTHTARRGSCTQHHRLQETQTGRHTRTHVLTHTLTRTIRPCTCTGGGILPNALLDSFPPYYIYARCNQCINCFIHPFNDSALTVLAGGAAVPLDRSEDLFRSHALEPERER